MVLRTYGLGLVLCLAWCVSALAQDGTSNTYTCKPLGFSLTLPEPWCGKQYHDPVFRCEDYLTADNRDLKSGIWETADKVLHLVSFGACSSNYPDVSVWVRFYTEKDIQDYQYPSYPRGCLAWGRIYKNLQPVSDYAEATLGGAKAGQCRVTYDAQSEPVNFEQWVIPRDGYEIRVEVTLPREPSEEDTKYLREALDSVRVWDDAAVIHYAPPKPNSNGTDI